MHLYDFVFFALLLPGGARRSIRIGNFHYDAQAFPISLTKALDVPAETPAGAIVPALPTWDIKPLPPSIPATNTKAIEPLRPFIQGGLPDVVPPLHVGTSGPEVARTTIEQVLKQAERVAESEWAMNSGADDEMADAKAEVDEAMKVQSRLFHKVSKLTEEETNTEAELKKLFFIRLGKKQKLNNALKELKAELSATRQLAEEAVDDHTAAMQRYVEKAVAAADTWKQAATEQAFELDTWKQAASEQAFELDTWKTAASEHSSEQVPDAGKKAKKNLPQQFKHLPQQLKNLPLQRIKENLLPQLIKLGMASVLSYAVWEGGFWKVHVGPSKVEDPGRAGADAFAFVNLARWAIPFRIGLTVGTDPWVDEDVLHRFGLKKQAEDIDWGNFAEDFEVVGGAGLNVQSLNTTKTLLKWLTDTPLNTGSGIKAERLYEENDSGEPIVISNWHFELEESDLDDREVIEELSYSYGFPLEVAGSSTFELNEDGMVERMRVGSWSINGQVIPDLASLAHFKELSETRRTGRSTRRRRS